MKHMKKKKLLASALCVSLVFSGILTTFPSISASGAEDISSHFVHRVETSNNDGIIRYQYQDTNGNQVSPPQASSAPLSLKKAAALPSSYDSRDSGRVTSVRDQGVTGGCWAFGALKSLEASSIGNNLSTLEDTDYSENHLLWYTYKRLTDSSNPLYGDYFATNNISYSEYYNQGGNTYIASFILANWWGAVEESEAPFLADTKSQLQSMASTMASADESLRTDSHIHLKEMNVYDNGSISDIKQAVMDYGALDVSLYFDDSNMYQNADKSITSAYDSTHTSDDANHCVTIVGWDDDFDTFSSEPENPGAWLIANSYGEDYSLSSQGYYWVSYYDTSLSEYSSFEGEDASECDTSFQYDGLGWSTYSSGKYNISFANIFTNENDTATALSSVGFYTVSDNQSYQVQVYRNNSSSTPDSGTLITTATTQGTINWSGYHTIELNTPVTVNEGETFSVVVTFYYDGTNEVCVPLEGDNSPFSTIRHSSSKGQSFIRYGSQQSWMDTTSLREGRRTVNMNNVCLKVFGNSVSATKVETSEPTFSPAVTDTITPLPSVTPMAAAASTFPETTANVSPEPTASSSPEATATSSSSSEETSTSLILKKTTYTIGRGESLTIPVTLSTSDPTETLSFESMDETIAQVTDTGTVTGVKKGITSIRITTKSGAGASVAIQVKGAPTSLKITAVKTRIASGHSVLLNVRLNKGSASYKKIFSSSRPRIATVSSLGRVRGKKKGSTWITVQTYNGKTARIKIQVV